ncbi:putative MFS-type transporter EfpA [Nonomuraea coxensis DSM 45129]|uniref:MFS-type transporter EfpA n=1 Tax=Nonomuraea coxensis DSM 45129 TaxID=1122611 RepID=A0ABX8U335_9ACTN|nr:MFS transporter [Nonomuraea coxensis]QYC42152.1 putative MFS-type transporter EfpA [Nonomuraea coxensis DSM 45129]
MSTTVQPPSASLRMTPRAWGTLFVLCGAIFLEGINVAMLNVALPAIRADLGLSTGELQWVISAYVLGYGGFMLVGGRAADLFGRRRMFLAWLAIFLVVSALGGMAGEGWQLIAARFVAGVAAAVMTPAGLSIITTSFAEGPPRNQALLVYSGTAAGGFSLGLVLGGLLAAVDWRLVLFAPAVLALIVLLLAVPLIPAAPAERPGDRRVDVLGAVTVTAAIMLLVLGVERAAHADAASTAVTVAAGLALLGLFVVVERRSAVPLLRLGLLRSGPLVRANLAGLLFAGAFFGFQFIAVLYLQELRGWSSLQTSLAMLAVGADAVLAPTLTPRLVNRFGNAKVIVAGLLLAVLSYVLFLPIGPDTVYLAMFPTMIVLGVAFALAYGPLTIVATDGVAESEQGVAGGLLYTSFQFGAALGLAASTAVIVATTAGGAADGTAGMLDGYRAALAVPIAAAVLAAAVSAFGLRRKAPAR